MTARNTTAPNGLTSLVLEPDIANAIVVVLSFEITAQGEHLLSAPYVWPEPDPDVTPGDLDKIRAHAEPVVAMYDLLEQLGWNDNLQDTVTVSAPTPTLINLVGHLDRHAATPGVWDDTPMRERAAAAAADIRDQLGLVTA